MKKTLVTMLAAVAVAASSYGQGTVSFVNTAGSLITKQLIPAGPITSVATADNGRVELLWAPVGTVDINLFQVVPGAPAAVGTPLAGRFSGGIRTVPAGVGSAGITPGAIALFAVRGYLGASYATATHTGVSGIFQLDTGDPTTVPAGTSATLAPPFAGLTLTPVPEPSSMALAGLGAASLLIFRRRK